MTTPIVAKPYGRALSCRTQMRWGKFVSAAELLGEAAFRRLITSRGSLVDDLEGEADDYGFPIAEWLNRGVTDDDLAALPGLIRSELKKDRRIESVDVKVAKTIVGARVELDIDIKGVGVVAESFVLAIHVSDVKAELLRLEAA